jgi:hypothetical protein
MKIIARSLCNFISVDFCIVASSLDLVKNKTPWPCWPPWQLRFQDGITSNPTDTCRINQVEYKLNSDVTIFFLYFFLIEIHRRNAMVEVDDNQPEVSLLFVVGCSTYLT